jgi:N-acetylglucosaminylphosphatidylinositol deacetylase
MFFAPTLSGLKREEFFVHITCFSSGNADGLGGIRKLELQNSAAILNVDSISVLDRT